jgi:tetratricopeptide (TPR) repeat protein
LYDLDHDPKEERNLVGSRSSDVTRLRGVLGAALKSEVRPSERRVSGETEERLRSLGYVAGNSGAAVGRPDGMDPKSALPLFRDFERAMEKEASGDLKESARILANLVTREPGNLTFKRSLASALRRGGRPGEAVLVLRDAEKLTESDPAVLHDLATTLAEQGQMVQAIGYENRAIAVDPAFVDALNHLSTLHAGRGDLIQAREAVDRALAIDPNNASAWSNRGNIARAQNQPDEAASSYERALTLSPDQVEALNGLGVLAVERGRFDEAVQRFERVLAVAPGFDEARLNLAVAELQRGRLDRALALATETGRTTRDPALRAKAAAFLRDLHATSR